MLFELPTPSGPFILTLHCSAVPINQLFSAASHHSITSFQVKMNLTFMRHRNAVTSQSLCNKVQCGNAMQMRRSMNGPLEPAMGLCVAITA